MEKTREMESSMRTDWDTPERTKLLAYSIAYRFKALCWRKQTREKFLGMERRFQSLLQPTKWLAAAGFGRIWRKDSHPARNIVFNLFNSFMIYSIYLIYWFLSCFLYPVSWCSQLPEPSSPTVFIFVLMAQIILEFGYIVTYIKESMTGREQSGSVSRF